MPSIPNPGGSNDSSGLSTGGVIGVVVGVIGGAMCLLILGWILRRQFMKRRQFMADREGQSRPALDSEMIDFRDTPGPYEYGAVGSRINLGQSGSAFREDFSHDETAPNVLFDARELGHRHQHSSSSSTSPETQALLRSVDGSGRFMDDSVFAGAGQRHSATHSTATTVSAISEYPSTPTSQAIVLPLSPGFPGSPLGSPPESPPAGSHPPSTPPPPRSPMRLAPLNPDPE